MGKKLKVLGSIIGFVIFMLGVSIAALPLLIDPNQFKPQLAEIIKAKTGRDAEFGGDLHLSVFPWFGLSTGRIQINNLKGFREVVFAAIDGGEIRIKVLPLFAKRLEIDRIVFQGLRVNLIRNQDGLENWRDLMTTRDAHIKELAHKPESEEVAKSPKTLFESIGVGGLILENARINWHDQKSGTLFILQEINLNSGYLTFDQSTQIDLGLSIVGQESSFVGKLHLKSDLIVGQGFEQIKMANIALNFTREVGNASQRPFTVALTAPELKFEKKAQQLDIIKLKLISGDFSADSDLTATKLFDNPGLEGNVEIAEFNPGKKLKELEINIPKFQDPNAFSKLQANFHLRVDKNSLFISKLRGKLDETSLQGEVDLDDFDKPSFHFEMAIDQIDADRYLSPKFKKEKMLVSPAVALAAGASKIPAEQLRNLAAQGDVSLQHLKFNGISVNDIHVKLVAHEGVIETQQTINRLYRGGYSGRVNIDVKSQETFITLTESVEHVQIEPILQAVGSKVNIKGDLSGSLKLHGQGHDANEIKQGLKGTMTFALREGEIKDLKFQKVLDQGISVLNHTPLQEDNQGGIDFSEISGTAALANQVIQNNDLLVKSSRFKIGGNGKADIESGNVEYRFVTKLVKTPATEVAPEKFHSTPIVVNMTGTFEEPVYQLDMSALMTEKNKAKMEKLIDKNKDKIEKLKHKLDKKFGPGVNDLLKKLF